ncbi:hypothetical protein ACQP00_20865 [Dactylosporangium sp. CS-047395]|uniref:hypothetical protein n=1 Tax=Dactylosporangium sp. CS-047395 TaxID=3239936 RepID=UPI003D943C47
MTLLRLLARRHRLMLSAWLLLLIGMTAGTVSAYQSTYQTVQQRQVATALAQHNAATTLMYGNLASPGTPALLFTWEIGAFGTILAAIMAVIVTVAVTRTTEDDGTLELLRSCGIDPRTPLHAALQLLSIIAGLLAAGCTVAVGAATGHVDSVTWLGAAMFGGVIGLTFLLFAAQTLVAAQILPSGTSARVLGFAAVGAAFGTRALADTQHIGWLNWCTPLGLRATTRPFLQDRWWALVVNLGAVVVLAGIAQVLAGRREYRAGLLRRRGSHDARLHVRSTIGFLTRLQRRSVLTWIIATAGIGTLFSAMGSGVVQQSQDNDLGGFLAAQLGTGDPVAGYFAYTGTTVGLVVSAFAILSVSRSRHDEQTGLTDHILAVGVRRWMPLLGQLAVTAAASLVILTVTGACSALVAPTVIASPHVAARAFTYIVGQWPATMVLAGCAALLAGRWPRWTGAAWLPLIAGGGLALLGDLLSVPARIRDAGMFQHVPDIAGPHPHPYSQLVLLAAGAAAAVLGVTGTTRRDVQAG